MGENSLVRLIWEAVCHSQDPIVVCNDVYGFEIIPGGLVVDLGRIINQVGDLGLARLLNVGNEDGRSFFVRRELGEKTRWQLMNINGGGK